MVPRKAPTSWPRGKDTPEGTSEAGRVGWAPETTPLIVHDGLNPQAIIRLSVGLGWGRSSHEKPELARRSPAGLERTMLLDETLGWDHKRSFLPSDRSW